MADLESQKKLTKGKGWKNMNTVRGSMEATGYPESYIKETLEHVENVKKHQKKKNKEKREKNG